MPFPASVRVVRPHILPSAQAAPPCLLLHLPERQSSRPGSALPKRHRLESCDCCDAWGLPHHLRHKLIVSALTRYGPGWRTFVA